MFLSFDRHSIYHTKGMKDVASHLRILFATYSIFALKS
jgi:hypothetical protein